MKVLNQILSKIIDRKDLSRLIQELKSQNKTIVFSNGCFDLVHRGHVEYLAKAADLADVFILGLNTDQSVSRLKGSQRPLQDQEARAILMAGFSFIDYVILFDEDTPLELITAVQPNVLVKGNDYKIEDVVGYDIVKKNNGIVQTIELTDGYSTSRIIDKIKKS